MKKILLATLTLSIFGLTNAADYKSILSGKSLVEQGYDCVGLSLKSNSGLLGKASGGKCEVDLQTQLKWIDNNSFILIEKNRLNDTSPPRTYLYKVKSVSGDKAVLTEIWTGWNSFPDENHTYTIKN